MYSVCMVCGRLCVNLLSTTLKPPISIYYFIWKMNSAPNYISVVAKRASKTIWPVAAFFWTHIITVDRDKIMADVTEKNIIYRLCVRYMYGAVNVQYTYAICIMYDICKLHVNCCQLLYGQLFWCIVSIQKWITPKRGVEHRKIFGHSFGVF